MYNLKKNVYPAILIEPGTKIFCEGQKSCIKLEEELKEKGFEVRSGCNETGAWSVYVISDPYNKK